MFYTRPLKTIGLIGGTSWESSLEYYRLINQRVSEKLGGLHSAQILMFSVDMADFSEAMHQGRWSDVSAEICRIAQLLERGGADMILICTNTLHKLADDVAQSVKIPLVHLVEATARKITDASYHKVGLLGTRFTMEDGFYQERLKRHGIEAIVPEAADRQLVHDVIFKELCLGHIRPESKKEFQRIIESLKERGAEAVVLGCTEIPLLIKPKDVPLPVLDTTAIHAAAAVDLALE